jgi:outer membrane lipoprotein-sorting protein
MIRFAATIVVMCLASLGFAAEVTTAAPAGVQATVDTTKAGEAAASTTSALTAGSTASALTAEEILKKWAAAYTSAKTLYEEAHYTVALDAPGRQNTQTMKISIAVRKPDAMRFDMTGRGEFTIALANGEAVFYNKGRNEYLKKTDQRFEDLIANMRRFPSVAMAISSDPYALIMDGIQKAEEPKAVDFDGRETYEIKLQTGKSVAIAAYFDRKTMLLIGIRMEAPAGPQGGKVTTTEVIDRILIDEFPKDAAGKEVDALAFTLPEGAGEYKGSAAIGTTDSVAATRERAAQSTDANLSGK